MSEVKQPVRVQLSRVKGWRMPANTMKVTRPSPLGNPYRVVLDQVRYTGEDDDDGNPIMGAGPWLCSVGNYPEQIAGIWFATKREAAAKAVELFRLRAEHLNTGQSIRDRLPDLRGHNLACWCGLDEPCHADVLLDLANRPISAK